MKIELVPISSLVFDPANARKHNQKNIDAIKGSLARFKQQKPIVVNKDNVVIAGNGTLQAAKELGWEKIAIVRTDLDGTDMTAFGLADNRSAELADWDLDNLGGLLKSLQEEDFDLDSIGFDEDDLRKLISEDIPPGNTDDDAVPENVETRCKPGDLWILGNHRLLCGDSTNIQHVERLMNGEKADMVFTDPPYGVSFVGKKGTMRDSKSGKPFNTDDYVQIKNDDLRNEDLEQLFAQSISNAVMNSTDDCPYYIFFAINRSAEVLKALNEIGLNIRNWLIWYKGQTEGGHAMGAQYKPCFESFLYCHKKGYSPSWCGNHVQRTVWEARLERLGLHPTTKPVSLIEKAIGNHPAKRVFDLFLGSGSTLIACEKTGRKCYGMEIDSHYCDVIVKRWEDYTGKQAVLQPLNAG